MGSHAPRSPTRRLPGSAAARPAAGRTRHAEPGAAETRAAGLSRSLRPGEGLGSGSGSGSAPAGSQAAGLARTGTVPGSAGFTGGAGRLAGNVSVLGRHKKRSRKP